MAHISSRPLQDGSRLSPLGRETSLQRVIWTEDNWLRLADGGRLPSLGVEPPKLEPYPFPAEPEREDFNQEQLSIHWNSLRIPIEESWLSLSERPGYLRLYGQESLYSWHRQSLLARRLQSLDCEISICVEFEPESFTQMAGLVLFYDESDHFYLRISHDEHHGKHVAVIMNQGSVYDESDDIAVINGWVRCYLKAVIREEKIQFYYSPDGEHWNVIGPKLYSGVLADEYMNKLSFTGAFAGVCVQDLQGTHRHADFDYFQYRIFEKDLI